MSQDINTQNLHRTNPGALLQKQSTPGHKINFVETSNSATGRLTLAAAGDASLHDFGYFTISFSYSVNGVYWSLDNLIAWNYCDFFIDSASSSSFISTDQYRIGSSAQTRARMSITISKLNEVTPVYPIGSTCYYVCQNSDSGSHTVDGYSLWKYIVTSDKAI